ncbi:YceI-like domain protein [Porphyromonas sp. oral taxon 278 str. W7784]|uniref:YceI family protein n=1 Tax=Porphyromonas sp. oral taxon 278 TaxID=712437 RepID=UPI0003AD2820|nr:YceI family protein [Porphyromonas sp. oral taxon 278]ERJ69892.1 YceI-like domain protein [Porphyromonas sp. oral taxon 278 str. W7784]
MKKNMTLALAGVLASGLFIASCSGSKGQNGVAATDSVAASAMDASRAVAVDTTASMLSWKGFKPGGEHYGKLPVSEGALDLKDGILRAGSVTIHLGWSLTVEDMKPGEGGDKLKAHLLSEDFFDVAKYPEVKFELTDIPAEGIRLSEAQELKGNLTLKDVTKNITIPIESVSLDDATGAYTIKSKTFTINRTDWNVKYGSKSFFKGLGDKFINDEIELSFVLKTK